MKTKRRRRKKKKMEMMLQNVLTQEEAPVNRELLIHSVSGVGVVLGTPPPSHFAYSHSLSLFYICLLLLGETAPQPAFQPGATEMRGRRRYLCFNRVGCITLRDERTYAAVEVEFHDVSLHRPVKVNDRSDLTMGVLCTLCKSSSVSPFSRHPPLPQLAFHISLFFVG